jgi:hypothetical protein
MRSDRPDVIQVLRSADPVSVEAASAMAESAALRTRLAQAVESGEGSKGERTRETHPSRRSKLGRRAIALGVLVPIAIGIAVSPAFGVSYSFLPFLDAQEAPEEVQVEFARLQAGAPVGMDPRAIVSETRKILVSSFEGREHVLWVAPTLRGGFCYEWSPGFGGCNADGDQALSAIGALNPVPGSRAAPPPPSGTSFTPAYDSVSLWIAGYVNRGVEKVVIRFKDGASVEPALTWVGAPIGAGFFAYDVPAARETSTKRATSVEAVASDGSVVKSQMLR